MIVVNKEQLKSYVGESDVKLDDKQFAILESVVDSAAHEAACETVSDYLSDVENGKAMHWEDSW